MTRRSAPTRLAARCLAGLAIVAAFGLPTRALAQGREGLVELSKSDPRLKGHYAPKGFKVKVVASEPAIVDPAAMAFDDLGNLLVAEWRPSDRGVETWEILPLPEGGTARVRRGRKATLDVVKRLRDSDGDGVYESSEVVVDGCELPTAILPWKNSLLLACVGRLERWSDDDGDGKYETRAILADGFSAVDRRGLSGLTVGADGWLYLTSGDDDGHVVGSDGSRVELARTGGVFRARFDGSKVGLFAMGLRNPYRGLAFDGTFSPFLLDGDFEDGSKFQGVRLVNPLEDGDYGWRLRPGLASGPADFDRASANGEKPGKLPVVAGLGRGSPGGLVAYNGIAFPSAYRGLLIGPDPARRLVRGLKVDRAGPSITCSGESTLMTADDEHFRPAQVVIGADGALYVLDRRGSSAEESGHWGEGKAGRLYRLTWEGDGTTPALPTKPNDWQRLTQATADQLFAQFLPSPDFAEADRALRELVDRGPTALDKCLAWAVNPAAPIHARLLGIQGARQLWSEAVESTMVALLADASPDVRRLAAQAIAWEPKGINPRLIPKLLPRLDDPDPRVVREVALAIGRHAEPRPHQTAATLLRWLYAHPKVDPAARDGLLRALERLGDVGVEEVALAVRTRRGPEREQAVQFFTAFRSAHAAEQLDGLAKIPDLVGPDRTALIRQYRDIPLSIPLSTQGLAEWVSRHEDLDPTVKIAALESCRLAGNPASALVLALLDDEAEPVRLASAAVAAQSRPPGAVEKLAERLDRKGTSDLERLAIVRALRWSGPKAYPALERVYTTSLDPTLRRAALRSMAQADPARAIPSLDAALTGKDAPLRGEAAKVLAESPRTVPLLARRFLDRSIGRAELPATLAALRKFESAENAKILASLEDDATRGSGAIDPGEVRARLARGADPWVGLGVFFRESSRCSTCHKVEGRGLGFGPSLALAGAAPSADALLGSILAPGRDVAQKFEASRVGLKDGRSFGGLVTAKDSKGLNLVGADGRELRIAADLVESVHAEHGSPMPSTAALDLTPDELADVVAFLQSKPAQDSLKHGPKRIDRVLAAGPFASGADRLRISLDKVNPSKALNGLEGPLVWSPRESTGWGTFNLKGEVGSRPGRAYLAVQIRSDKEQSAALRLGADGATRVYLNGTKVADLPAREGPTPAQVFERPRAGCLAPLPDLARLPLKSGWNLLIVALDYSGEGEARASMEVASPEPVEVRLPKP